MTLTDTVALIKDRIRDVPDFPRPGIMFKDITPLMKDQALFRLAIEQIIDRFRNDQIDYVVGIESRGFIMGAPIAYGLQTGFVPVRKPGKLPYDTLRQEYQLEYGSDALEIHNDAIEAGRRVLIVDDLLATGGTVLATTDLVRKLGAEVVAAAFLVELSFLGGRERVTARDLDIFPLVTF